MTGWIVLSVTILAGIYTVAMGAAAKRGDRRLAESKRRVDHVEGDL